jgi:hypothetical protein
MEKKSRLAIRGKGKEGRPNDLDYWMGYKITETYYQNSAVDDILNMKDFGDFMKKSGF